jgi:prepilin-type N-terminal cleavage/methylation domain-containing protein
MLMMSDTKNNLHIPASRRSRDADGFTLVELMVTIVVLGIVITSLGGLYYINQILQTQSQHYDLATRAARTEIEDLRNDGYSALTPGDNINFTSSLPSALPANKTGIVDVSSPDPGLIRVDVNVSYTDFGISKTVTLSSDIGIVGIDEGQ